MRLYCFFWLAYAKALANDSGETGIRTLGKLLTYAGFQDRYIQPALSPLQFTINNTICELRIVIILCHLCNRSIQKNIKKFSVRELRGIQLLEHAL